MSKLHVACFCVAVALAAGLACAAEPTAGVPVVSVDTPMPAPAWARLERELLAIHGRLAEQWDRAYLRADGTTDVELIHGGGTQAPDDFFEAIWQFPLAYALGAPRPTFQMYWKAWKGSLRQFTAQGLLANEMAKYLDWHHNGEHYEGFWLMALCIPNDPEYRRLSLKYASFYDGTEPNVANYDPVHKVIRSMNSGGAGPVIDCRIRHWVEDERIVSAAGDGTKEGARKRLDEMKRQLDVLLAEPPKPGPNSTTTKKSPEPKQVTELRQAINRVEFWSQWLDCAHDGPVNLVTTCFGTNAFLLTGDANYKRRTMEYIDAWRDRAKANGGIVPSIVKLDGTVPKEWWGGVMGWDFTPFGGVFQVSSGSRAAWGNALLLTGDRSYYDELRCEADEIWAHRFESNVPGVKAVDVPRYRGKDGWYGRLYNGLRAGENAAGVYASLLVNVYLATMSREDLQRILDRPVDGGNGHSGWDDQRGWINYLVGKDPNWAERSLADDLARARASLAALEKQPDCSKGPPRKDALGCGAAGRLVNCMTGGGMPLWHGQLLLARFRYFDPERKRPGISENCAALVESMADDSATLVLVNTSADKAHRVLVQAGAYTEHRCVSVTPEGGQAVEVNGPLFAVKVAPGAGQRLVVKMKRYANPPTARLPWAAGD